MHIVRRGEYDIPPFVAFDRADLLEWVEQWWLERIKGLARSHQGASWGRGENEHFHVFLGEGEPRFLTAKELEAVDWPAVFKAYGLVLVPQPPVPAPAVPPATS